MYNTIKYKYPNYQLLEFNKQYFNDENQLSLSLDQADVIIHFAGLNRHENDSYVYEQNILLSKKIINSLEKINFSGKLIFASSTQENDETEYGNSKKESRKILEEASSKIGFQFSGLIIPNVFGPFSKPNHNSFIATFCNNSIKNIENRIIKDKKISLIYVDTLTETILNLISSDYLESKLKIKEEIKISVFEVKKIIDQFALTYLKSGEICNLDSPFKLNLFKTFVSYLCLNNFYPFNYKLINDDRGSFSEIIRSGTSSQFSYSITNSGKTRGNHFHTRKIERFVVLSGIAEIKIRKIGSDITDSFILNGDNPSFIDMPVWHTHNIKNIGNEPLITLFWINEFYDETDPDTFFEKV